MEQEYDKYHNYLNHGNGGDGEIPDDLREFLDGVESLKPTGFQRSKSEIWDAIDREIDEREENDSKVARWPKLLGIAATVSVLLLSGWIFLGNPFGVEDVAYATALKEQKDLSLPDGSMVTLNAGSKLEYEGDWNRSVALQGEAFFRVTKGEKFKIVTELGEVEVLGTSFNVKSRSGVFSVTCKTGKVRVSFTSGDKDPVILTPGNSVLFEDDLVVEKDIETETIGNWQSGEFYYDNRPLFEVLEEIERQYGVTVQLTDPDNQRDRIFKGLFIKEDLETALSMVCEPMGLKFQVDQNVVIVR